MIPFVGSFVQFAGDCGLVPLCSLPLRLVCQLPCEKPLLKNQRKVEEEDEVEYMDE